MKFVLILSIILTIGISAQKGNAGINYEQPEIRKNNSPAGNWNSHNNMLNAPSADKKQYIQNNEERVRLRSEIAREFDVDALKQWILHLGKLNLNMITNEAFISDISAIKGYSKTLEGYIRDKYQNVLNHLALIDLKLKEIKVVDQEVEHVKAAEPHHLKHPCWKDRLEQIVANSASANDNFNTSIFGIKKVIERLTDYLNSLEQTYIDPKSLDYSQIKPNVGNVLSETIPSVSTYLNQARHWLNVHIIPIVSNNLLVDSGIHHVNQKRAQKIPQKVQQVAVKELNKKKNVKKIEQIVGNQINTLGQANAKIAQVITKVVEKAIQKVNNKKADVKVNPHPIAEEVKEKVTKKLDNVTQGLPAGNPKPAQHHETAKIPEVPKTNNKKTAQAVVAQPTQQTAVATKNNKHKSNKKNVKTAVQIPNPTAAVNKKNNKKNAKPTPQPSIAPKVNNHKNTKKNAKPAQVAAANVKKNNKNILPAQAPAIKPVEAAPQQPKKSNSNTNQKKPKKNNSHKNNKHDEAPKKINAKPSRRRI